MSSGKSERIMLIEEQAKTSSLQGEIVIHERIQKRMMGEHLTVFENMIDLQKDLINSERDKFEAKIELLKIEIVKLKRENAILKND
mgnify:CR=1 FL=1|tara:strand:- start:17977 stop:18234 length:258 start_codon:yes stop_codon:yes gene_type:complete